MRAGGGQATLETAHPHSTGHWAADNRYESIQGRGLKERVNGEGEKEQGLENIRSHVGGFCPEGYIERRRGGGRCSAHLRSLSTALSVCPHACSRTCSECIWEPSLGCQGEEKSNKLKHSFFKNSKCPQLNKSPILPEEMKKIQP